MSSTRVWRMAPSAIAPLEWPVALIRDLLPHVLHDPEAERSGFQHAGETPQLDEVDDDVGIEEDVQD